MSKYEQMPFMWFRDKIQKWQRQMFVFGMVSMKSQILFRQKLYQLLDTYNYYRKDHSHERSRKITMNIYQDFYQWLLEDTGRNRKKAENQDDQKL